MEQHIRENLRLARRRKELSMGELSKLSTVAKSAISNIESGSNENPTINTIIALCSALEIGIESLFIPPCETCGGMEKITIPCPACMEE